MTQHYIYTVTAITTKKKFPSRCFGFFFDKEMAETAVEINSCDLQECLYEYVVIEKQRWGIHSIAKQIQWYVWEGDKSISDNPGKWVKCEKPKEGYFKNITNWNGIA